MKTILRLPLLRFVFYKPFIISTLVHFAAKVLFMVICPEPPTFAA